MKDSKTPTFLLTSSPSGSKLILTGLPIALLLIAASPARSMPHWIFDWERHTNSPSVSQSGDNNNVHWDQNVGTNYSYSVGTWSYSISGSGSASTDASAVPPCSEGDGWSGTAYSFGRGTAQWHWSGSSPPTVWITNNVSASGSLQAYGYDYITPFYTNAGESVSLIILDAGAQGYATGMGTTAPLTVTANFSGGLLSWDIASNQYTTYTTNATFGYVGDYLNLYNIQADSYSISWNLTYSMSPGSGGTVDLSGELGCDTSTALYVSAGTVNDSRYSAAATGVASVSGEIDLSFSGGAAP